jgi:hypothetical protein
MPKQFACFSSKSLYIHFSLVTVTSKSFYFDKERTMNRFTRISLPCLLIVAMVAPVSAQFVFEQEMTSNGYMGMMAFTSKTTTYLTPDAKKDMTSMQFTGGLMKHFNSKDVRGDITRLDKELFWNVNYDKKKYTEMTFAELRELWKKGIASQEQPEQKEAKEDQKAESEYEWDKPIVKVLEKEKGQTMNGFKCNHYIVQMIIPGKHKATGIKDTMSVVDDTWNSTIVSNAMKAMMDFNTRMFEKMQIEKPEMGTAAMMAAYKEYMAEVMEAAKKLEGYSVNATVRMAMTTHVSDSQKPKQAQPEQDNVDVTNPVGGLMGKFAKNMAKKAAPQGAPAKDKEIFQFSTQLKSIKKMEIPSTDFDIPAGFKKEKND